MIYKKIPDRLIPMFDESIFNKYAEFDRVRNSYFLKNADVPGEGVSGRVRWFKFELENFFEIGFFDALSAIVGAQCRI